MEGFLGILILAFLVLLVLGPVLAITAHVKLRKVQTLEQRLDSLEIAVAAVERRVRSMAAMERPAERPAPAAPPPSPGEVAPPAPQRIARRIPRPAKPEPTPAEAPPPPPPRPPVLVTTPTSAPPPPPRKIDWERWIGIRGAAAAGAVVLAIAGLLFFQYSIQRGLITPPMRVALGIVVGLGCLVGSEVLRPRGYKNTMEWVSGAGIVILYAAFWAAHSLYALIGVFLAFGLLVLVTVTGCLLAVRHSSQAIAVLGLLGGFATPLLLRSEADRPIGLFGYVLLLDLGLIAVGKNKGWPLLGLLSLIGTALLQGLWIGLRMDPARALLGLAILAVFAVVFVAAGAMGGAERVKGWAASQAGGALFPFVFAIYFASRVELGEHLVPIAVLLAILTVAACWVARAAESPQIGIGAALGDLAVIGVWLSQRSLAVGQGWELALTIVVLAILFHLFVERGPHTAGLEGPAVAAVVSACGGAVVLIVAAGVSAAVPLWPWLVGWLGLAALLHRHAGFPGRENLPVLAAAGSSLGLSVYHLTQAKAASFPGAALFLAVCLALGVASQIAAIARREGPVRTASEHAAALFAVALIAGCIVAPLRDVASLPLFLAWLLVLGILALLSASRLASGAWIAATGAATLAVHWILAGVLAAETRHAGTAFAFFGVTVLVFTFWPFVAKNAFLASPAAWIAAALAGPAWFFPLKSLHGVLFGKTLVGALPVALGACSLAAVALARRHWPESDALRRRALVWFSAVAISFVSVAIPLQLEKEWITIGWALEGAALAALWRRLDHPGLKWLGVAALVSAAVRLVANPALLGYYPRSGLPLFNWILYTYLVPAGAMLGAAAMLQPFEAGRAREWERSAYGGGKPVAAIVVGLCAIATIFLWINVAIADYFTEGPTLTLQFGRSPARDLTVSIAWALYAIALLVFGMLRDVTGLRWLSLGFLVFTIGKVFLYDLGELRDLYRVASLVGLAVSLILVSLLYQRFVFRKGGPRGGETS